MTRREAAGVVQQRRHPSDSPRHRLAGSYVNFYLANGAVIVPLIDRQHRCAGRARALRAIFPAASNLRHPAREILLGGGNIHCITQQLPGAGRRSAP